MLMASRCNTVTNRPSRPLTRGTFPSTEVLRLLALLAGAASLFATWGCFSPTYIETGDLPEIRSHGRLRILMPPLRPFGLPRRGYAINHERRVAAELAERLGLEPVIITIQARDALVEALLEGRGDLVIARLTITEERESRLAFSQPVGYTREVVAVRAGNEAIREPADLDGRRVGVRASSSFFQTLQALREESAPGMELVQVDEHRDADSILSDVAGGLLDATVVDEDQLEQILTWRSDVQRAFNLTGPRPIAWAMRPGSERLKEAVDSFLQDQELLHEPAPLALGDLDAIKERKVLRVLTRNNAATTFLHRGKQVGFEYELVKEFARSIGCRVQLVIPPGYGDLVPWLLEGRGDIIAASLVVMGRRQRRVAFTHPYLKADQVVVARAGVAEEIDSLKDLSGMTLAVRRSSPYRQTLEYLRHARGLPVKVKEVPESLETEELIDGVAEGTYEATVAVSHILEIALAWREDVAGALSIGEPLDIAWAVRPEDTALLQAADAFLSRHGKGSLFLNVLRKKYFTDAVRVSRRVKNRPEETGRISPWDDTFRKYGSDTGIDWRLLAAQAYQESQFRPSARSWAGAVGLMQVLPRTARELGTGQDLLDPEVSIRAGALYMRKLMDDYFDDLPDEEMRVRFALGAYNAGPGHIRDGRRLASEKGYDPNRWFGHVETVLPLLSRGAYASRAAYGYCRCRETVEYVRRIEERYRRYRSVLD